MFWVFGVMGLPCWLVSAVRALYLGSSSRLSCGGIRGPCIKISSGIKQGCPMSGSLWCIIFDPIIRAMSRVLSGPRNRLGVFADDVGIGCGDCVSALVALSPVLDIMRVGACLTLNWKKTYIVNFGSMSEFAFKRSIEQALPIASAVIVCRAARYLGFIVGPDAFELIWKLVCAKMLKRARHVRSLGLSLAETCVAFNVFVFSVARFVLQLVLPSSLLFWTYGLAIDIATGSPRYSMGVGVLCSLRRLGMPGQFPDLDSVSMASKYTVAVRSEVLDSELALISELRNSDDVVLQPRHEAWIRSSSVSVLAETRREVAERIVGVGGLAVTGLQAKVAALLGGEATLRRLLLTLTRRASHFGFSDPGERARTFVCNMAAASVSVRPFVLGSMIRTICNAHPTSRRFGWLGGPWCRLGCYAVGGDDVRHYAFCPILLEFMRETVGGRDLSGHIWVLLFSLGHFMLLHEVGIDDVVRTLFWNDVVMQAANSIRCRNDCSFSSFSGLCALRSRLRVVYSRVPGARKRLAPSPWDDNF